MEAVGTDKQRILERERRWGKPVAYSAIASAVIYLVGLAVSLSGPLNRDTKATQLESFYDHSSVLLLQSVLSAIGFLLLIPVFYFLFRAVQARNPAVRKELAAFSFIGPVLLSIQVVLSWVATNSIAKDYLDQVGSRTGQAATDLAQKLIDDSTLFKSVAGLGIPGTLGIIIIVFYLGLMGMRTGVLTRFWGTFGMAFGIGFLILGPVGINVWALYVGLLAAGWINRPPAWEAVEAIPWPAGGIRTPPGPDGTVEGNGREIDVAGSGGDKAGNSVEPSAAAPRKRKRRG
ncbi:MAG: DUF4386 family protein [Solirubrobacterales bacterium]